MTPFEQELKQALARREPDADFAARVMAAVASSQERSRPAKWQPRQWFFATPMLRACTLLAVFVLLLGTAFAYRRHVQREQGEAAKKQLMAALHIAGAQLREAQLRVKRIEFPEVVMQ